MMMAMNTKLEETVWTRAKNACEYCRIRAEFEVLPPQVDHIISVQQGGLTSSENLCLACYRCNHHKGPNIAGWDPKSRQIVPLFNPRTDRWSQHFRLRGGVIVGRTICGRITAKLLGMNHPRRIVLREVLIAKGRYP